MARILVVEDDPRLRALLVRQLAALGHEGFAVSDVAAGLASGWTGDLAIVHLGVPGATSDDTRRIAYTQAALTALHHTITEGVDLRGYLHWSALDNYEWGSYAPTFGLIAVDRRTFTRTRKPSAHWLGQVAKSGGLPAAPPTARTGGGSR